MAFESLSYKKYMIELKKYNLKNINIEKVAPESFPPRLKYKKQIHQSFTFATHLLIAYTCTCSAVLSAVIDPWHLFRPRLLQEVLVSRQMFR